MRGGLLGKRDEFAILDVVRVRIKNSARTYLNLIDTKFNRKACANFGYNPTKRIMLDIVHLLTPRQIMRM